MLQSESYAKVVEIGEKTTGDRCFEVEAKVGVQKVGREGASGALLQGRRKGGAFSWVEGA